MKRFCGYILACSLALTITGTAFARDLEYKGTEADVFINPGEPTQVRFPGKVIGGYKSKISNITVDRKDEDVILFAQEGLSETGDAIIVRLEDGRSYSLRVKPANELNPRDTLVKVEDGRGVFTDYQEEDETGTEVPFKDRDFAYAPSNTVSGLMREMVLVAEFGKKGISGYRVSERYKGEPILNDGAISAVIDRIFIGPNLWGYVIDASNMLDQGQKINPASFRIDGTRAIMAERWELAPRPLNIEQQIARGDRAKIYIVTRAKG
jgi:hypothetical protein